MITLHRKEKDPEADKIEQKLKDLVLAYDISITAKNLDPYIVDGNEKVQGEEDMEAWFQKLEGELQWQRSLSGDGCYINPDTGEVC